MNFLALVQMTKRESGRLTTGPAAVAAATGRDRLLCDGVIRSWRNIQQLPHNWAWMRREVSVGLTVGQATYTATDLGITRLGRFAEETEDYQPVAWETATPDAYWSLTFLPYERFRSAFQRGTPNNDVPQYWSVSPGGDLLIGPAPDRAITLSIDYYLTPQELAADADEPEMPSRFHELIVWATLADAGVFDAAPEVVGRGQTNYAEVLSALIDAQGERITLMGR